MSFSSVCKLFFASLLCDFCALSVLPRTGKAWKFLMSSWARVRLAYSRGKEARNRSRKRYLSNILTYIESRHT